MDSIAEIITEEAAKEFPMSNSSKLSDDDVNRIAEAIVEKAAEDVGVRDIMIGSVMGKGAIPLYGRETRKEPCACCLIDPEGPNAPENRMCTTKGAIGTLKDSEEREWCSEINIVSDGRCTRAMAIREVARECKEKYPTDTEAFFRCYIPAFSKAISPEHSNPSLISEDPRKEKYIRELVRTEITLGLLEADLTQMSKRAKELAEMTWDELLEYSPSKKGGSNLGGNPKTKYLARLDPALATRSSEEKVFDSPDEAIAYAETLKAKMLPGDVVHVREGIGFEYKVIYRYQMP